MTLQLHLVATSGPTLSKPVSALIGYLTTLEANSLSLSATVKSVNCHSEVNSVDSEFPARNQVPFS